MNKNKKMLIIIWSMIVLAIVGLIAFYFVKQKQLKEPYEVKEETTSKKESENSLYEDLLEMDYKVIDVKDDNENIFLTLQGDFTKDDILSYSNKLLNLLKNKKMATVYFFNNDSVDCIFRNYDTEELVAYTVTDFTAEQLSYNSYEDVSISPIEMLNVYNENKIQTIDNMLSVIVNMQKLDNSDLNAIASQAKGFSDLFINSNKDKNIDNLQVTLNSIDVNKESLGYAYNYEMNHNTILLVSEIKTFSKK